VPLPEKMGKKRSGIAPLRLLTLASFRTWGIQQELVVPLATKIRQKLLNAMIGTFPRLLITHESDNQPDNLFSLISKLVV